MPDSIARRRVVVIRQRQVWFWASLRTIWLIAVMAMATAMATAMAVAGGMNTLRVWGGGAFLPDAWYDACDEAGVLVYHDMQYAQSGHAPAACDNERAELRHQVRRRWASWRAMGAAVDFRYVDCGATVGVAKQSRRLLVNSHLGANDVLIVLSANRVINKPILCLGNHVHPHLSASSTSFQPAAAAWY